MAKSPEPTKPVNLTCEQCGHENEAERVYCHNCGGKFDRSLLPKEDPKTSTQAAVEAARKHVAKMTNPGSGGVLRDLRTAANVLFYAALAAGVLLIVQKPDGVPEAKKELPERSVGMDLMDAIDSPQPRRVDFTEAEINGHLQQILKKSQVGGLIEFRRLFVNFQPGDVHFATQQDLFGLPIYSGVTYRVATKDKKLTATLIGGNFGRLAVHPDLMQYLDFSFQKLWTALSQQKKQLADMQTIVVQKGTVSLVTKGGAAP